MNNLKLPLFPQKMNQYFADAYNSGEVENLIRLFEENAKSVTVEGNVLSSVRQIKSDHQKLLQLGGRMTSTNIFCVEFENIALLRADWIIKTFDSKGQEIEIIGSSSEIVRKQSNGTWLYVIDHPFAFK